MSALILPDSEPTDAKLILPGFNRRGFMKTLTVAFTGLLVQAPAIAKAANLMQIHSPDNKLVVAFCKNWYEGLADELYPSMLNFNDWTEVTFRAWEALHPSNTYSLVRQGAIPSFNEKKFGGVNWLGTPEDIKERQRFYREETGRAIKDYLKREEHRAALLHKQARQQIAQGEFNLQQGVGFTPLLTNQG